MSDTATEPFPAVQVHTAHTLVAGAVLVLSATAFSLEFQSYLHAKELVLCLALVPLALLRGRRGGFRPWERHLLLPFAAALIPALAGGWIAGTPWGLMLPETVRVAVVFMAAVTLWDLTRTDAGWTRILWALSTAGALSAALGLLQWFNLDGGLFPVFPHYDQAMYSIFGNQDALGGYLAITLPMTLALTRQDSAGSPWRHCFLAPMLVLVCVALVLTGCRSAWLASAAALAVLVLTSRRDATPPVPRGYWILLGLGVGTALVAAPGVSTRMMGSFGPGDIGAWSRLWFTEGALRMIASHPLLGVGPSGFEYWSPQYLGAAQPDFLGVRHFHNEIHTLRPHNDLLELMAASGIPGALLCLALLWGQVRRGARAPSAWAAIAAAGVFALCYPLWSSTAHVLAVLLCMGSIAGGEAPQLRPEIMASPRWTLPALSLVLAAVYTGLVLVPSHALTQAEQAHLAQEAPQEVDARYRRAIASAFSPAPAWRSYGVFLQDQGRFIEAVDAFERARRALDTGELYWYLGLAQQAAGDRRGAEQAFRECARRWPWHTGAQAAISVP